MFGLHVVSNTGPCDMGEDVAEGTVEPPVTRVSPHKLKQLVGICQLQP